MHNIDPADLGARTMLSHEYSVGEVSFCSSRIDVFNASYHPLLAQNRARVLKRTQLKKVVCVLEFELVPLKVKPES
ncbi:jg15135 [Pararge aegeria aegeria]|uniref:Jg15135 protein n=1 Tax=Pararge aegeria aegeria TaxID=348720 RepID=A0A8S4RYA0_9NEOP|nr:jg15135 [Pararge aegeria aegeria]